MKQIKILGKPITINEIDINPFSAVSLDGGRHGTADLRLQRIDIASDLPQEQHNETILHETLHMISDSLGLDLNEAVVTALSSSLYCVLKENGINVDFGLLG